VNRRELLKAFGITAGWAVLGGSLDLRAAAAPAPLAMPIRGLVEQHGTLLQPIRIAPPPTMVGQVVTTVLDGVKLDERRFDASMSSFDVFVPAVESKKKAHVVLRAEETEAAIDVELLPVRRMRIYVLPHSHHDLGYTDIQAHIEDKQVQNIYRGIELARKTATYPDGARFVWNLEVLWGADLFMRRGSPADRTLLIEAVQRGWVALNGSYANELTGLCGAEELMELFRYGVELGRQCKRPIDAAMFSDVPGYTWGTVSAMAQAGVRYFSAAPNSFDRIGRFMAAWQDRPFWWVSPSGTDRVLFWVPWHGYALSHGIDEPSEAWVGTYQARMDEVDFPYDISYVRWSGHGDNAEPDPGICEFVRAWNETYAWPKFTIASVSTAFADFEREYGSQLPSRQGDLTPYWEDGAGSSAKESAQNRAASQRLVQAGTLAAMARHPKDAAFDEAWRNVLLYSEHTWGADESVVRPDSPMTQTQWAVKRAFAQAAERQSLALANAGMTALTVADAQAFAVANTSSWDRSEIVRLAADLSRAGDRVIDAQGQPLPSQRLSTGELAVQVDVPALAVAGFTIESGKPVPPSVPVRWRGHVLDNGILKVHVDSYSGDIDGLYLHGDDHNLVDRRGGHALNRFLFLAGDDAAALQSSAAPHIVEEERGPLLATLRIESSAPGCRSLVRRVTLCAGQDRLLLENCVDKLRAPFEHKADGKLAVAKESLQFAFPFAVEEGRMALGVPFGQVRPEHDQLPGSCKNWLPVHAFVDIANTARGVTCVMLDAPLVEVGAITATKLNSQTNPDVWIRNLPPSQTFYSWVMNNHWGTNYRAFQEGPVTFRYAVRPYRAAEPGAQQRFGQEQLRPLLVSGGKPQASLGDALLRVQPAQVVIESLAPSRDGKAWMLRLFNASAEPVQARLNWRGHVTMGAVHLSNLTEDAIAPSAEGMPMAAWEVLTLRVSLT